MPVKLAIDIGSLLLLLGTVDTDITLSSQTPQCSHYIIGEVQMMTTIGRSRSIPKMLEPTIIEVRFS